MIFCEAILPSARRLFHHPLRFPIADAHYAMGFAFLYQATGDFSQLENAIHFLTELKFRAVINSKNIAGDILLTGSLAMGHQEQTPLITTTPYVYEAFLQVFEILQSEDENGGQRTDMGDQRICPLATRESSNRLRATPQSILRISGRRKQPAVVPILLSKGRSH